MSDLERTVLVRFVANMAPLVDSVATMSPQIKGMLSDAARAIGESARQALDEAGKIADAADRMGIGAEAVQRLAFAAEQGGASLDNVAAAMSKMAQTLGDGKDGTVAQLEFLKLNIDALRAMSPDQAFVTIADAIGKMEDPLKRAEFQQDLLGKGAAKLIPAMIAGFGEVGKAAPLMSNALVAASDETGDKLAAMQKHIDTLKAQALLPLMNTFVKLPESVQVATAGISQLIPSFQSIATMVLAAGGPKAALLALSGLFTTTLPAAFSAILPFLGPVGIIAAAVGAVFLVWKNWDKIADIAKGVYDGVKNWMVDRFNAIVDSIKGKVEAVKGFFKGMFDAVVGGSYVPDMINAIGEHFGRLDSLMVGPTFGAARGVEGIFSAMASTVNSITDGLLSSLQGKTAKWGELIMGGLTNIIGAGLNSLISFGISKITDIFTGGEEATHVNPARDAFLSQFGPGGTGPGSGFHELAKMLVELRGTAGGALFQALIKADTMQEFNSAVRAIEEAIRKGPMQAMADLTNSVAGGLGGALEDLEKGFTIPVDFDTKDFPNFPGGFPQTVVGPAPSSGNQKIEIALFLDRFAQREIMRTQFEGIG